MTRNPLSSLPPAILQSIHPPMPLTPVPGLYQVIGELLRAKGCNVHIECISCYINTSTGQEFSFWEVSLIARARMHTTLHGTVGETAIGYKPHDQSWVGSSDTLLNPPLKDRKRRWHPSDVMIVLY